MRSRLISTQKYNSNCELKPNSNQTQQGYARSSQISYRGSLTIKPCLKKINSTIFQQIPSNQIRNESNPQLLVKRNELKPEQKSKINSQQKINGEFKLNKKQSGNFKTTMNDSISDNSFYNNKFIQIDNHKIYNSKINSSRASIVSLLSRFRSITTNDQVKRNQSISSQKREESTPPQMKKKIYHIKTQSQLNHQNSITFVTLANMEENYIELKDKQQRSHSSNILDNSKQLIMKAINSERKIEQCQQIKKAFTLLPNNKYLHLEDDKIITIRTPISSSTSSSSLDFNSSSEKTEQYLKPQNKQIQIQSYQNLNQSNSNQNQSSSNIYYSASNFNDSTFNVNQNFSNLNQSRSNQQKAPKLNESSKQFLKQFIKERKIQEKLRNTIKKSNHVKQLQQNILNKALNEMNKEKESQLIIKDFESVQLNQKLKKEIPSQNFKSLIHFRPKEGYFHNKTITTQVNQGLHQPKTASIIARIAQEQNKQLTIHCKKQNFFGSDSRRNLNIGVPQIIQNLHSIKN